MRRCFWAGVFLGICSAAQAQNWLGNSGSLTDGANWVGGNVPATGATVSYPAGSYAVSLDSAVSHGQVTIGGAGSDLALDLLSGGAYTVTGKFIPATGAGAVTLRGAGQLVLPTGALFFWGDTLANSAAGTTFAIDGGRMRVVPGVLFGAYGGGNLIALRGGGELSLGTYLRMGNNTGGTSNAVTVTGSGSRLALTNDSGNVSDCFVGSSTAGNRLTVSDGGTVYWGTGTSGTGAKLSVGSTSTSSGNRLEIIAGGVFTNPAAGALWVGDSGSGNGWLVSNAVFYSKGDAVVGNKGSDNIAEFCGGAKVTTGIFYLGMDNTTRGFRNKLAVRGSGTELATGNFIAGRYGLYSEVRFSEGATAALGNLYVGDQNGAVSNVFSVVGSGTRVTAAGISLGSNGQSNLVEIAEGGELRGNSFASGGNSGALGVRNAFVVRGGGLLLVTNAVGNLGASSYVGQYGSFNTMTVENGGQVVLAAGINGLGQNFSVGENYGSSNNVLVIRSGGAFTNLLTGNQACYFWAGKEGNNNTVIVDGGYVFNRNNLLCANFGRENLLEIKGGSVVDAGGLLVADGHGTNNLVRISGAGTRVTTAGGRVGGRGSSNRVEVADGGLWTSTGGVSIGNGNQGVAEAYLTTADNILLVTDGGTFAGTTLTVGLSQSAYVATLRNSLVVSNSGLVTLSGALAVGNNITSHWNTVWIGDGGAITGASTVTVGVKGSSNEFAVCNGSAAFTDNLILGAASGGGSGNVLRIAGSNSVLRARRLYAYASSEIVFELPVPGYLQQPAVLFTQNVPSTIDASTRLKISGAGWFERTGGTVELLRMTGTISGASLADLVAGAATEPAELKSYLGVSADGMAIVLSAPKRGGTILKLL